MSREEDGPEWWGVARNRFRGGDSGNLTSFFRLSDFGVGLTIVGSSGEPLVAGVALCSARLVMMSREEGLVSDGYRWYPAVVAR